MTYGICKGVLIALIAIATGFAYADQARKLPTIGMAATPDRATAEPYDMAFREALRNLGYVDGENVTIIERFANSDPAKLRQVIKELVALHVDVLWGDAPLLKEATTTIPIVSPTMGDPVKTGLVVSLAHPGGNITGVSGQTYDVWPKQLELAKELIPNLRHLCLLFDKNDEPNALTHANVEFRALARGIGITVRTLPVGSLDDLRAALKTIRKEKPQALIVWASALLVQHQQKIMDSTAGRIPVMGDFGDFAKSGAVLTYSVDWLDMFKRSAVYVVKILKGANPGDLPIEQPTKFELVVNLKTAKTLGIAIPQSILLQADEVIR